MDYNKSFKRHPYAKNTIIFICALATIGISILIFDGIANGKILNILFAPLFLLLPLIISYVLRKTIFSEIRLNDEGVAFTYKNQVLKEVKWQDMKNLSVHFGSIIFSKNEVIKVISTVYVRHPQNHLTFNLVNDVNYKKEFFEELKKHLTKLSFDIDAKSMERINKYANPKES